MAREQGANVGIPPQDCRTRVRGALIAKRSGRARHEDSSWDPTDAGSQQCLVMVVANRSRTG